MQVDGDGGEVSALDHPLLRNHELLWGQFVLQFVSQHDDPVSILQNAFELVNCFQVVDLCENADVLARVGARVSHLLDVLHRGYVRDNQVIKLVFDSGCQNIVFVRGLKHGQVG